METLVGVLLGGGVLAFIQFLITRYDTRHDKNKEVLQAVNDLDRKMDDKFDQAEQKAIGRFNTLDEKIETVEAKGDERAAISARVRILRFSDELQEGRKHSKDAFDQCMSDITFYETYCDGHPKFINNQTELTVEYIKHNYAERLEKHDFL